MNLVVLLADVAPLPPELPSHVWWKLLAGVAGLAAVGIILIAVLSVSFRRARRTVREARAEHAALSEQLLADARAHATRADDEFPRADADREA